MPEKLTPIGVEFNILNEIMRVMIVKLPKESDDEKEQLLGI
jgi:hypothetical protein